MKESFELQIILPVQPVEIYEAWLDSSLHSKMTGGNAECSNKIDDPFTAWDGYISGKNLDLKPNKEIIQSWRTTEFSDEDEDSQLKIILNEVEVGTEITLIHSNIPAGQTQYEQGWKDHYFEPMVDFFKGG